MAQLNSTEPLSNARPKAAKVKRTLSRTHADYWKPRLIRRTYANDGRQHAVNDLYVRIQHGGRREFFPLTRTNQDAAAVKARDIFIFLKANGWPATLDKFKPAAAGQTKLEVSIGDFLSAIEDVLDTGLPRAYDKPLYEQKCTALFEHVYESYPERDAGVYAAAL